MIKAIETVYNGYRFRSRLEARWAVFFDTLGIKYEYEKEGYTLPDSSNYLPDFYLPSMDLFVEIKGTEPTKREKRLAEQLSELKPTVIAHGLPGEYWGEVFLFAHDDNGGASFWLRTLLAWSVPQQSWIFSTKNPIVKHILSVGYEHTTILPKDDLIIWVDLVGSGIKAIEAAKQARFEFNNSVT